MFKYTNISKPFSVRPPHGGVNCIEIPAVDVQALEAFYQGIFPSWQFPKFPRHQDDFIALLKIEEPAC
ncbi:hypothetical protein CPLU01_06902 [Colletotrichum plurivorum]|uniref:Uncharacterized protein n=1 Tax=Colletotrichum plurivorum TaxID=2175906 RepID=A0A8H6KGN9_9PEZI|nr:hypothetical protein CPLU01_06902 [Colletotrichum plurivorum]